MRIIVVTVIIIIILIACARKNINEKIQDKILSFLNITQNNKINPPSEGK